MSNVTVKNASGTTVSFKTDGAGSDIDPHISHLVVDAPLPALVAGTANIGDVDVLTLPALPAGTNNIGDVDVLTLPALPAGTNNIGDVDVLTIAAGDNNIGNVDVVTMPSITIGTMGNLTESLVDDAAFTPATSRVVPVGFEFDDTTPDSVNEGDIGAARMSANRNLYTTLRDAAGNERGANVSVGNALLVDASATTQPVSGTVNANLAAGTNNIGDVDVLTLPALPAGTNNIGDIDVLTLPALPAGTNNIGDVDVLTLPALPAGTNNIGDVDVLTIAAGDNNIGNVDVVTLPALVAGTALVGSVNVQLDASTMRDGAGTALTPKFAIIDHATSGNNTLVAAVASKKIRVLAGLLIAAGTVIVRFESGADGTALTGQMNLVANVGFQIPFCPVGNFETAATTLLNLELSAAVSVDGWIVYVEV